MLKNYYTPTQVAKRLGVVPYSVWRYLRSGKLKGKKFGRNYLIHKKDLNDFLKKCKTK